MNGCYPRRAGLLELGSREAFTSGKGGSSTAREAEAPRRTRGEHLVATTVPGQQLTWNCGF